MDTMKLKEEENSKLKSIINNLGNKFNFQLMIFFRSMDGCLNEIMFCYYNELFSAVEERLYTNHSSLRKTNNIFLYNGKKIEKNNTILLNEITENAIILLAQAD